jgi:NAD(P)-dependent dehydrogenase (short-subunit alcohol dehydrogenase family)
MLSGYEIASVAANRIASARLPGIGAQDNVATLSAPHRGVDAWESSCITCGPHPWGYRPGASETMLEDIAAVPAFLASEDARWVTGSLIDSAGGLR